MLEISISKIKKDYGFGNVLDDISFEVMNKEIVALIGENGCGKSTLLKIIAKKENPTSGTIAIRKNSTIGYLDQIITEKDNVLTRDILYRSIKNITDLEDKLRKYEDMMQSATPEELEKIIIKYSNLQEEFISKGGYEISEKIGRIITGFKLQELINLNYNNLSGGEQRLVTFAALMIESPDILLLDEPTNHLDIDVIEWLENYLKNYKGTIIIVSHDRYFLDKISNKTILIERGKSIVFNTNYSGYIKENEKRIELELKQYKDKQKEIKSMKESAKRLREFGKLGDNERFFKRAKAIERRIEKTENLPRSKEKQAIPFQFNYQNRSGKDVLVIKNLNIKYGDKIIFSNANMQINYGDKVCLVGKNGSGKTTLIKNILNNRDNIKIGSNVKIGYIPQQITFEGDNTIYEYARKHYNGEESHLRSALFKFLFIGNDIFKKTASLSGGEKVRLKLFCLMQEDVNFLILDEPTNHIDISTREVLENTLKEYAGTLLIVSHDRYFINKVSTKIISIEKMNLTEYSGNYDDYKIIASKTTLDKIKKMW